MKKKIYNILSVCLFALLVSACYDDKGNYDYHEISTINTEGLEKSYMKTSYQDVLHLEQPLRQRVGRVILNIYGR